MLNLAEGVVANTEVVSQVWPFATEASWATGRWLLLEKYTRLAPKNVSDNFNVGVGRSLLALHDAKMDEFTSTIQSLRQHISEAMSKSTTSSFGAARSSLLKLHVLAELELIAGTGGGDEEPPYHRERVLETLERRLEMIGGYLNDKQYLLSVRRAAMQLSRYAFDIFQIGS